MNPLDAFLNESRDADSSKDAEQRIQAWQERIHENLMVLVYPNAPYWQNVTLVAVTKHVDTEAIQGAFRCGLMAMGENKAVEALTKRATLPVELNEAIEWHFLGRIQRNKLNKIVGHYDLIHSVDTSELLQSIAEKADALKVSQGILLQVNTSGESSKQGVSPEALPHLVEQALKLSPQVQLHGLMTMAPLTEDDTCIDDCFGRLNALGQELEARFNIRLPHLSMGMSHDYGQALSHGATIVRIGTKLFA